MNRIPSLASHRYDVQEAARQLAIHCVEQLRADKRPDRETNANATLHSAVLAEMLAFKSQLDKAVEDALKFGLQRIRK